MRFWSKKKSEITPTSTKEPNLLEQLCGDDTALYEDLSNCLYLHPVGKLTYEDAMKKAATLEKEGKIQDALRSYWHDAGAAALYENNVEEVKKAFGKYRELSGRSSRIVEIPEKAVELAREFYYLTLKPEMIIDKGIPLTQYQMLSLKESDKILYKETGDKYYCEASITEKSEEGGVVIVLNQAYIGKHTFPCGKLLPASLDELYFPVDEAETKK